MDIDGSTRPVAGAFEAIAALVAEHAWLIDHGQADRIAALYVSDGRMLGAGPDLVGRAAIEAWGVGARRCGSGRRGMPAPTRA